MFKKNWNVTGAIVGAIAASLCCLGPLVLLVLGIGGAWAVSLTVLEPFRPVFGVGSLLLLGIAFYRVYRTPNAAECKEGDACVPGQTQRKQKMLLWLVTPIIIGLLALPYFLPTSAGTKEAGPVSQTARAILEIEGMTCNGCVLGVTHSLQQLPGVEQVQVTLKPPRAIVVYHPSLTSPDSLVKATSRVGYPSRIIQN